MKHLLNNFYLLPKGFRLRKVTYTFSISKYREYEDFVEYMYIKLFWRFYLLVRVTTFFDPKRPPINTKIKYRVL